ncbi:alpha/beta fold hydrolase [Telluria beijingensis]|uniref:alpha/beta fold hydrolase n=1 Tax=Telluria beijingensis TaxID=3068633 RepID=UPI002795EA2A|nr:alpha/beta hydrolase [Massilia sp. REN29]
MEDIRPAVILVHGATLNGRSWDPVRRRLEPRLRVLAPDLPGHGARRGEPFTLQGGVDTVVACARALGNAPFILAGDSLGSYTAQAAAASLPQDRLKGLVLGGASHEFIGWPVLPYMAKSLLFRTMLALRDEDVLVRDKMPATLRDCGMNEADVAATMEAGVSLKVFAQAVRALHGVDFKSMLAAIAQPTLFINGDQDRNHVRGEARYVAAARQARVLRFAGSEHGVSLRRAADYAAAVDDFARQVLPLS